MQVYPFFEKHTMKLVEKKFFQYLRTQSLRGARFMVQRLRRDEARGTSDLGDADERAFGRKNSSNRK